MRLSNNNALSIILIISVIWLNGCDNYEDIAKDRHAATIQNDEQSGPVKIGLVWDKPNCYFLKKHPYCITPNNINSYCNLQKLMNSRHSTDPTNTELNISDMFIQGAELAIKQINENKNNHRKIKCEIKYDSAESEKAINVANEFAIDRNIVAVMGHATSSTAIPVSITYEINNILYLSPAATNILLTQHNFLYTQRLIPNNQAFLYQLGRKAVEAQYKKVAVIYERNDYGQENASIIKDSDVIDITYSRSFLPSAGKNFQFFEIIAELKHELSKEKKLKQNNQSAHNTGFDIIFFGGFSDEGKEFINNLRKFKIQLPVFSGDGLDSSSLYETTQLCEDAQNTLVPTAYNASSNNEKNIFFKQKFNEEYNLTPDTWAAQGYDAVKLFWYAVNETKKTTPKELAYFMRYLEKGWQGVSGKIKLNHKGDLVNKAVYVKMLKGNRFIFVDDYNVRDLAKIDLSYQCKQLKKDFKTDIQHLIDQLHQKTKKTNINNNLQQQAPKYRATFQYITDETIIMMDNGKQYDKDMHFLPGTYTFQFSKPDYINQQHTVTIVNQDIVLPVKLKRKDGKLSFSVNTRPDNANIRILNITPKYQPGILLNPGRYHIEVRHPKYKTIKRWITLANDDMNMSIDLQNNLK